MFVKHAFFIFSFIIVLCCSCVHEPSVEIGITQAAQAPEAAIWHAYDRLPEAITTVTKDSVWFAQYIHPTTSYGHGILGDAIEARGLVLYHRGQYHQVDLPDQYVFEDIAPRFINVNGDSIPELLCIRTDLDLGAGIVLYQLNSSGLEEYAYLAPIGMPYRWLNIVAVKDLDADGILELVWIQTPHIGGILKTARVVPGLMEPTDAYAGVSNHAIGERNLCLSALIDVDDHLQIVVPNQARDRLYYFNYDDGRLTKTREESQIVDFSRPLVEQINDPGLVSENNCWREW